MANRVTLSAAECALDLGDGSERGLYVNQDYILQKMHAVHRGISLMYTYYPNDKTWPIRSSIACPQETPSGAWDYPYEDYFPYRGGREGLLNDEPFCFMKEIRKQLSCFLSSSFKWENKTFKRLFIAYITIRINALFFHYT